MFLDHRHQGDFGGARCSVVSEKSMGSLGNNNKFRSEVTLLEHGKISKRNRRTLKKCIILIASLVIFITFIMYEFIVTNKFKTQIKDMETKISKLEFILDQQPFQRQGYQTSASASTGNDKATVDSKLFRKQEPTQNAVVAINLSGNGYDKVKSKQRQPYYNWKLTVHEGNIGYDKQHGHIIIKTPGIYYVYAQMYPYENNNTEVDTLEFQIRKNYETIAYSSTPKRSCLTYCTLQTSRISSLKAKDEIYVTSQGTGIQFYMSDNKAQFGIALLK